MRREALDFLLCPNCGGELALQSDPAEAAADGHLIAGALGCDDCSSQFPIREGVPVLLPANLAAVKLETASRFAEEWTRWSELRDYYEQEFFDWVAPLTAADFAGQTVFEGGCGKGRLGAVAEDLLDQLEQRYGLGEVGATDTVGPQRLGEGV